MTSPARPPTAEHILTYAESWRGGGVERVQLRLARGWIAAGRRVTLVIGDASGPLADEVPAGVEIVALGSRGLARLALRLPHIVAARRPDLIFCPGNHYTGVAGWLRLKLGRACPPIAAKVSNALARSDQVVPVSLIYRRWLRWHRHFLSQLVAMTPGMADEVARAMAVPRAAVAVIANPPAMPIPGAAVPDLPAGRFLLGVGRLVAQKRWDRLIAALPSLADPDVRLVILGEGSARAALTAQIATLGLAERVTLPGHAPDPLPAIARAAAVVLVSDFEGVPGVLREALASGTPVVTTESSVAVREIVSGPELGTIVAADDPTALVAALDHWLTPGRVRPAAVAQPGEDAADEYLALFDRLVRLGRSGDPHEDTKRRSET
ncbi:glycosyl transferase [Sphingomonas sp. Leaf357]|uniref:glycosyltransferase n=1 Tax=Sphingomonas sp. Leaf357 TaxID=1736350 RepID=UPI0006F3D6E0|nr:glycosyltransferase [Sphingomonas sp. Leaf357]KQS02890.1 glycosyl transferase [Sphingomonas sp. Leaf357]